MSATGNPRLDRVLPVLACPGCRGGLDFEAGPGAGQGSLRCAACDIDYPVRGGKAYFLDTARRDDDLDSLKGRLKALLGKYYYTIGVDLVAPTYPFPFARRLVERVDPSASLVADLGCGNRRLHPDTLSMDMFPYPEVDVVCDIGRLPLADGAVRAVVSRSVLEHVPDPWSVAAESLRVTEPGGTGMHLTPFMMPFHASPHDYHRFTHKGLERLFAGFEVVEQYNATGPATYFLLGLVEFLSSLLSFGNARARSVLYLGLCGLTFPLKFLDAPLVGRAAFMGMCPSILTVLEKPA